MHLPKIYDETCELLSALGKRAFESYRGSYIMYHAFIEYKMDRLKAIEEQIIFLDKEKQEDLEKYNELTQEIQNMYNVLEKGTRDIKGLLESYKEEEKEEPVNVESNDFSDEEIDALLNSLDEEKRETVYPTQNVDQLFEPLDIPDIKASSDLQPIDLETHNNLPR